MNPLTLVKRIQKINTREAALGVSEDASWHAKYKDSAYVFVGGVPFDLTEGDLLAVFAQYGEIVDVNLVRDKATGKSKGFAFVAYEDQRSTNLAVDNLNGAQILGRVVRVDHCNDYKKKEEEEDEEELQRKREERGVCRAFQRGECTRGASCKFSHNEQRARNTGWGAQDKEPRWGHDMYDGQQNIKKESNKGSKEYPARPVGTDISRSHGRQGDDDVDPKSKGIFDRRDDSKSRKRREEDDELDHRHRQSDRRDERQTDRYQDDDENRGRPIERHESREEYKSRRDDGRDNRSKSRLSGVHHDASEGNRSKRHESESYAKDDRGEKRDKRSPAHGRERSSHRR